MATYEYVCLACEGPFERQRSITASVETAVDCPSCGSQQTRRRFSLFSTPSGAQGGARSAGCACGGACACGGHRA